MVRSLREETSDGMATVLTPPTDDVDFELVIIYSFLGVGRSRKQPARSPLFDTTAACAGAATFKINYFFEKV